ncbi:MAG: rRNA maturation RNase YbeY [Merismopedia sp. SIO2A8]|nr:rRNA maturation RNase YbeY [Merismopedia sp. SIO2A8]
MNAGLNTGLNIELSVQDDAQGYVKAHQLMVPSVDTWQFWFKQWLTMLNPRYSPIYEYELSLSLTTDDAIRALNYRYRQRDSPTDVLAFAALDESLPPAEVLAELPVELGDIVISVETAQRQAHERHHSLTHELAWLASHGLLHLLGWDHPTDIRLEEMLDQQVVLLKVIHQ